MSMGQNVDAPLVIGDAYGKVDRGLKMLIKPF